MNEHISDDDPIALLEHEITLMLRRARRASNLLAQSIHEELEPNAYVMLLYISTHEHARVTDMAAFIGVGKPTISRQLQTVERLGLIHREADAADSRSIILTLTAAGHEMLERVKMGRRELVANQFSAWDDADKQELIRLLTKWNADGEKAAE